MPSYVDIKFPNFEKRNNKTDMKRIINNKRKYFFYLDKSQY